MMTSSEKKMDGPTSCSARDDRVLRAARPAPPRPSSLELLVDVLDHDDGGVDHGADGDGDAAERHDVRGQVLSVPSG